MNGLLAHAFLARMRYTGSMYPVDDRCSRPDAEQGGHAVLSHELDALQTDALLHAVALPLSSAYRSAFDVEDALEDAVDTACAPLIGTVPRPERLSAVA